MTRHLYLKTTDIDEAKRIYQDALTDILKTPKTEMIPTEKAYGRVVAKAIYAKRSSPFYPSAAMDGIMIDAKKTLGANEHHPLMLDPSDYVEIDTGDPVLDPYDAVIMAEDCIKTEDGIQIIKAHVPWENVRPIGEDIVEGELLFTVNHALRPMDISVLMAAGQLEIEVFKKVRLAIIPTGTEIIEAHANPQLGDIIESNSYLFKGMALEANAEVERFPILKDDYDLIVDTLDKAANDYDIICINAGSSAGREDFTSKAIQSLGEVYVHGLAIKPGKPAILGRIRSTPVIGIPGFPVSAHIVFSEFVVPLLYQLNHCPQVKVEYVEAISTKRIVSSLKYKEYIRVKLGQVDDRIVASPLPRGAGVMMSVVRSDGYALIDQNSEGIEMNEKVMVRLNPGQHNFNQSLVMIGSHDMMIDVAQDFLAQHSPEHFISSSHVGSFGGLMALKRKECHLAPIHLLGSDGFYNREALLQLFKPNEIVLIKGIQRIQGLLVAKGNPLNIQGIEDLSRVHYVNRQRGAGTRVLLDHLLKEKKIDPSTIKGYEHELSTHLAVASAIQNKSADCGMGVYSAAQAMGCDFIEIGEEAYDFACHIEHLNHPSILRFIEVLKDPEFQASVLALGGYRFEQAGEVITFE